MIRVFVALLLGAERGLRLMGRVRTALGAGAERGYRLPRAEGLHLTLFFLGDVEHERIELIGRRVETGVAGMRAPRLSIDRTGAFPRRGRERVLWLGVEADERLTELHGAVLDTLRASGFDTELERSRPFRPHVTVARPRPELPAGGVPADFYELELREPWTPARVALVESVRGGGPAVYRPIREYALGAVEG